MASDISHRKDVPTGKDVKAETAVPAMQGPDPAIIDAARQGMAEESGYINKIGRANECAAKAKFAKQGEQVSDHNQLIAKNAPVVDVSTNKRLVSVKGTDATRPESQFNYLKSGFDDLYHVDARYQAKRLESARGIALHSKEINLPSDYPLPKDPAAPTAQEVGNGAEYIRKHGQLCVPWDARESFITDMTPVIAANLEAYGLRSSQEVDGFLNSHVIANDLSTADLRKLTLAQAAG